MANRPAPARGYFAAFIAIMALIYGLVFFVGDTRTLDEATVTYPEVSVVPISARWMVAEAAAGLVPMASSSVVEVAP